MKDDTKALIPSLTNIFSNYIRYVFHRDKVGIGVKKINKSGKLKTIA